MKTIRILSGCLLLWLTACSPNTRITASWVKPSTTGNQLVGKTIFVASLSRNMEVRTKLENALQQQGAARGINIIKSTEHFAPDFYQKLPTEQQLLQQIKRTGADAILTVSLLKQESETRYQPGSRTYAPFSYYRWYGGFYSYMNYWRPMIYEPGYYVTDKTYFLETNLYDMRSAELIWSAQSETVNPGSIDNFVSTYPKVVIARLVEDRLLPNNP